VGAVAERPGRAQGLVPAIADEVLTATAAAGTVVFGNFYAGKNGAAHGGSVPLLFDEVFGRMGFASNTAGRTAFLRTDYRSVTPTGAELTLVCRLDRVEGRKRYFSGELRNGEVVCVEAESLWVELKPGQP
jgi:acyl-coenzyme A thioesterase PaaI-like protein